MSDCVNIEMRELLPDLLHEELSDGRRAQVEAHVAACPSCTEELSLLREAGAAMREMYASRIDTAAIVAALPKPGRTAVSAPPRARSPLPWRIAAAIGVIALGGVGYGVARLSDTAPTVAAVDTAGPVADSQPGTITPPVETTLAIAEPASRGGSAAHSAHALLSAGGVGDLDETALQSLLGDLERIEAAPVAEPEVLTGTRLVSGGSTGPEE